MRGGETKESRGEEETRRGEEEKKEDRRREAFVQGTV